jgi:hypothetical protein
MTIVVKNLLLLTFLSTSACALDDSVPDQGAAPVELTAANEQALSSSSVSFLKQRILSIARANTTRTDNLAAVKAQLRPYVRALVKLTPDLSEEEKLARSEGAWRNVWTDLRFQLPLDLARLYQVVTTVGHYWNLSVVNEGGGATSVNALRGAYAPIPEGLAIRFTTSGTVNDTLVGKSSAELIQLAADIESGAEPLVRPPGPPFPSITGKLITRYIDAELRILGGENAPLFDDDGNVFVPGQYDELFVLERQVGVTQ